MIPSVFASTILAKVSRRPHLSKSLVELTAIFAESRNSPQVLAEVVHELKHRKSNGARKLLARIESSSDTSAPEARAARKKLKKFRVKDDELSFMPANTPEYGAAAAQVSEQLKALRETFTEGAELLARWGATTALPDRLLDALLTEWAKTVTDVPDEYGRSLVALQNDLVRWRILKSSELLEDQNG